MNKLTAGDLETPWICSHSKSRLEPENYCHLGLDFAAASFEAAAKGCSAGELDSRGFSSLSLVKENRRALRDSAYAFRN